MSQKKPTLGRSLAALLPNTFAHVPPPAAVAPRACRPSRVGRRPWRRAMSSAKLPLDLLQRGKYQPRVDMRQETLQELADSIKAQGVVQPIVVRPVGYACGGPVAALRDHCGRAPLARVAARGARGHSRDHPAHSR